MRLVPWHIVGQRFRLVARRPVRVLTTSPPRRFQSWCRAGSQNAIFVPSGDQVGLVSLAGWVVSALH